MTINLLRRLPLPEHGRTRRYKLVQSIRLLLLSPLSKSSPLPVCLRLPFSFYSLQTHDLKFHILSPPKLLSPAQPSPLKLTPDTYSWYCHTSSPLTHQNQVSDPCGHFFSYSLSHLNCTVKRTSGVTVDSSLSHSISWLSSNPGSSPFKRDLEPDHFSPSPPLTSLWPRPNCLPPGWLQKLSHWWPWFSFCSPSVYSQ